MRHLVFDNKKAIIPAYGYRLKRKMVITGKNYVEINFFNREAYLQSKPIPNSSCFSE